MANEIIVNGDTIVRKYQSSGGGRTRPDIVKAPAHTIVPDHWIIYRFSPAGTSGNIDPVNHTTSGVTLLSTERPTFDETIAAAKLFILTARRRAGTTAAIVDNTIVVTINSVEVGRLYVDGSDEEMGRFVLVIPEGKLDSRFALSGGSNGRFNFSFTAADPSLEVYLEVAGSI